MKYRYKIKPEKKDVIMVTAESKHWSDFEWTCRDFQRLRFVQYGGEERAMKSAHMIGPKMIAKLKEHDDFVSNKKFNFTKVIK